MKETASVGNFISEFNELAKIVEVWLQEELATAARFGSMAEVSSYPLSSGGKRVRPILCVASAKLLGVPLEQIRPLSLALELIHTFSLVHDDLPIMDDDDLRRGLPTTHKKFGEAAALLAGDSLLGRAFGALADTVSDHPATLPGVVKLLSEAVLSLCDGQLLDLPARQLRR